MGEKPKESTGQLEAEEGSIVLPKLGLAYGTSVDTDPTKYTPLPASSQRRSNSLEQPWRVVLMHPNPKIGLIGLAIYDDVVLGRLDDTGQPPDLDLTAYAAQESGVSRRHAMLRPTPNQLFLIDLGSTNGTLVNMMPQRPGIARALKKRDQVSLGNLHFTIERLDPPTAPDRPERKAAIPAWALRWTGKDRRRRERKPPLAEAQKSRAAHK